MRLPCFRIHGCRKNDKNRQAVLEKGRVEPYLSLALTERMNILTAEGHCDVPGLSMEIIGLTLRLPCSRLPLSVRCRILRVQKSSALLKMRFKVQ